MRDYKEMSVGEKRYSRTDPLRLSTLEGQTTVKELAKKTQKEKKGNGRKSRKGYPIELFH